MIGHAYLSMPVCSHIGQKTGTNSEHSFYCITNCIISWCWKENIYSVWTPSDQSPRLYPGLCYPSICPWAWGPCPGQCYAQPLSWKELLCKKIGTEYNQTSFTHSGLRKPSNWQAIRSKNTWNIKLFKIFFNPIKEIDGVFYKVNILILPLDDLS